ncbi:MAG: BA14K family protein [Rhizobiaceae bacterium]|nr:BA14K family protein [Rhizobiaceae bacterium]
MMNKITKSIALVCAMSVAPAIFSTQANSAGVTSHMAALPNIAISEEAPIKVTHKLGHILGGVVAGALITGAIVNSQRRRRYYEPAPVYREPRRVYQERGYSNRHLDWCFGRYRSYREYDNSYQPYNGPRRLCRSPYY